MNRRRMLMAAQKSEDLILNDLLTLDGIQNTRAGHDASATTWQDISGNNYDASKNDAANDPIWQFNHAVFDAINRGLFVSHNFFSGRTAGTIELVAQVTGEGSRTLNGFKQGFILSNRSGGDSSPQGFHSYSYNATGVSSFVDNVSIGFSSTSSSVAYICWVFDNGTAKRYLNGVLANTKSITYSHLSKNTLRIGYEYVSNAYVGFPQCNIYRIGISSTAFSEDELAARYARLRKRFNF